jgi:hypothetical protein
MDTVGGADIEKGALGTQDPLRHIESLAANPRGRTA